MRLLDETQLNTDRATIQLLHGRLGNELARAMAYGAGNFWYIEKLNKKNILISNYLEILSLYNIMGNDTLNSAYNVLSTTEVESIIDDCYRELEKWNVVT